MQQIAILEDDAFRTTSMRQAATQEFPGYEFHWFSDAFEMVEWLKVNLHLVRLLSLDHDLDSTAIAGGERGSGGDVVAFLIAQPIRLPVLVHSSNALRAPGLHLDLVLAGFCTRLCPFTDAAQWAADIRQTLGLRD
jgi:hypothetical protein